MTFRAPPLPTDDRAVLTKRLIETGSTDTARWARMENLATQWDARAAMAAKLISPGSHVLDIGAGAMALRGYLSPTCRYSPADVVERCPGCFVVDLNLGDFPTGAFDYVTFLGVLEYVHDVPAVLRRARTAAPSMVVTYCAVTAPDEQRRRGMGWVNDFTAAAFEGMLSNAGWVASVRQEVKRGPANTQYMYACLHQR
ncbi:MAG: class I SAM-dependent methyltransferase [Dongiaceae bacterium]